MVKGLGIASEYFDGQNILECFNGFKSAYENVLKNKLPYFLEFSTYRWREHCGPNFDDDLGYRDDEEIKNWIENCPLKKIELDLEIDKDDVEKVKSIIDKEVLDCFCEAENAPFPNQDDAYNDIYA